MLIMPFSPEEPFESIKLFHVTKKKFVKQIEKHGLQPKLSRLTKKAFIGWREDQIDPYSDEKEYLRELRERANNLKPMVFAVNKEDLPMAINIIHENFYTNIPEDDLAVFGIKTDCIKDEFKKRMVGSDMDYVSYQPVKPECLIPIKDEIWQKDYENRKRSFGIFS